MQAKENSGNGQQHSSLFDLNDLEGIAGSTRRATGLIQIAQESESQYYMHSILELLPSEESV